MILELLLSVLALGVCLLGIGEFLQEPIWSFIGLFFFFILGLSIMGSGVNYKIGENETSSYVYTGGQCVDNCTFQPTLLSSTTERIYSYGSFEGEYSWWFGFLLALGGGFGMSVMFWNLKSVWGKNE